LRKSPEKLMQLTFGNERPIARSGRRVSYSLEGGMGRQKYASLTSSEYPSEVAYCMGASGRSDRGEAVFSEFLSRGCILGSAAG